MQIQAAPLFEDIAPGPAGGAAWWLKTADGVRIRIAAWPCDGADDTAHGAADGPADTTSDGASDGATRDGEVGAADTAPNNGTSAGAKGTVLLFPGRTEYVEKYGDAAREFAARGYATLAIDWRGQGLADRLVPDTRVGHVEWFSDYQIDTDAVVEALAHLDLPRPFHLIGHSMGGAIGLNALMNGLDVASACFTGPMWGISIAPVVRQIGWTLAVMAPKVGFGHKLPPSTRYENYVTNTAFEGNALTRDREMYDMMRAQIAAHPELAIGGPTLTWLREALGITRAMAARPAPALPCLTFVGAAEHIVDVERIRTRMAAWPGGELVVVPEAEHEVMMEVPATRRMIFDRMAAHFDAAPAPADTARTA